MSRASILPQAAIMLLAAVGHACADCCQIPVTPKCQPGQLGQGSISPNQGQAQGDQPPDVVGSSGDGTVNLDAMPGQTVQLIADSAGRAYFSEPAQLAVIAWNGRQQILVLKTHEKSTVAKGATLSVLPLPGKVLDIRKGDKNLYDRAFDLVWKKLEAGGDPPRTPELERKIGPHNIFVWKLDSLDDFKNKVQTYIAKRFGNNTAALFTKEHDKVLSDYFKLGFRYFAFDLKEVETKVSEKHAIEYHFESKFVYYPLMVSRAGGQEDTRVQLVVFTRSTGVNRQLSKLRFDDDIQTIGKKSVTITAAELKELHPGMAKLFDGQDVRARIWVIRGRLDSFPGDVMADYQP